MTPKLHHAWYCRKGQSNSYVKESLRKQPAMSYGLGNSVNKVSDPVLLFLTVLQLDIKKKENVVPKTFYFCTR